MDSKGLLLGSPSQMGECHTDARMSCMNPPALLNGSAQSCMGAF